MRCRSFPEVLAQTADAKLWIVGGGDDVETRDCDGAGDQGERRLLGTR